MQEIQQDQIKIHYYDFTGAAEACRLALTIGGIPFEDIRYTREQYNVKKLSGYFKFGQVPIVEINGVQYAQSQAIDSWAARKAGLFPTDSLLILKCDEARNLLIDLQSKLTPVLQEQNHELREEMKKNYIENIFPHWAAFAEKLLETNGSGYFVGNSLTIADIKWYTFLAMHKGIEGVPQDLFSGFERLTTLYELVNNLDQVQEWNKAHNQQF